MRLSADGIVSAPPVKHALVYAASRKKQWALTDAGNSTKNEETDFVVDESSAEGHEAEQETTNDESGLWVIDITDTTALWGMSTDKGTVVENYLR